MASYPTQPLNVSRCLSKDYKNKITDLTRTPDQLVAQIHDYAAGVGGFEIASLQVNFNTISLADAENSMRLFSAG